MDVAFYLLHYHFMNEDLMEMLAKMWNMKLDQFKSDNNYQRTAFMELRETINLGVKSRSISLTIFFLS